MGKDNKMYSNEQYVGLDSRIDERRVYDSEDIDYAKTSSMRRYFERKLKEKHLKNAQTKQNIEEKER